MKFFGHASCLFTTALLFVGCSIPPPHAEIATADMALRQARQSHAPQYSSLEMRTATEKLNRARQAMADEDYLRARRSAEQALVDAQLAESKAQALDAQRMTADLRKAIEALRREAQH